MLRFIFLIGGKSIHLTHHTAHVLLRGTDMQKTPASLLNDLMTQHGWKTKYEFEEPIDRSNPLDKMFTCNGTCYDEMGNRVTRVVGTGLSKKQAKHEAAESIVRFLISLAPEERDCYPEIDLPVININKEHRKTVLEMLCTHHKLGIISFRELDKAGQPHIPIFTIECSVSKYRATGTGTTKKDAKLEAITNLLKILLWENNYSEIYETPQLEASKRNRNEICLTSNLRSPKCSEPIGVVLKKHPDGNCSKRNVSSQTLTRSERATNMIEQCRTIELSKSVERTVAEIRVTADDQKTIPNSDVDTLVRDFTDRRRIAKSLSLGDLSEITSSNRIEKPNVEEIKKTFTVLQLTSRVTRTLNSVEKLLKDEAEKCLQDCNFEPGSSKNSIECIDKLTDQSIRITRLVEILQNWKQYSKNTFNGY